MTKKPKSKKVPAKKAKALIIACPDDKPLRGARLLRSMFADPGAAFSIEEISASMGNQKHSARASISTLGNPAKTENPLKIILDRKTGKYSVATAVAGASSSAGKATDTAVAGADSSAKEKPKKKAAPKAGSANGPRAAA